MRDRRAVTLIELIIVILIISILVGMMLPVFSNVRRRAAKVYCDSQIGQIAAAVGMYARDYHRPPPRSWLPSVDRNSVFLPDVLSRYLGGQDKVFRCPGDSADFTDRPPPNEGKSFLETERASYAYRPESGVSEYEQFHSTLSR